MFELITASILSCDGVPFYMVRRKGKNGIIGYMVPVNRRYYFDTYMTEIRLSSYDLMMLGSLLEGLNGKASRDKKRR